MTGAELIQSGLLEAYVLGQLEGEEARLVERMRAADAGVHAELEALEEALEAQAMANAIAPPPDLKNRILDQVATEGTSLKDTPVVPFREKAEVPRRAAWSWLSAAAVVALLISLSVNVLTLRELGEVRGELARLENDRSVLAQELEVQRTSLQRSQEQLAVMTDPRTDVVLLNGTGASLDARARIYWDRDRNAVYLDVLRLPAPPEGKQYQLWALVDGQPVDAGVFAMDDAADTLQAMKTIPAAQAFAVTLEKAGGSPTPTLDAMVLLGNV